MSLSSAVRMDEVKNTTDTVHSLKRMVLSIPFKANKSDIVDTAKEVVRCVSSMDFTGLERNVLKEILKYVKDFWFLSSSKMMSLVPETFPGWRDADLMTLLPSLGSIYIDLFICCHMSSEKVMKWSKQLYSWLVFDLNDRCLLTALLEVTQCHKKGAQLLMPIFRKLYGSSVSPSTEVDYLLYMLVLRRWQLVHPEDLTPLLQIQKEVRAPKNMSKWLRQNWPQASEYIPAEDKSFKGRQVTELLLSVDKASVIQLIDVFDRCLMSILEVDYGTPQLFAADTKGSNKKKKKTKEASKEKTAAVVEENSLFVIDTVGSNKDIADAKEKGKTLKRKNTEESHVENGDVDNQIGQMNGVKKKKTEMDNDAEDTPAMQNSDKTKNNKKEKKKKKDIQNEGEIEIETNIDEVHIDDAMVTDGAKDLDTSLFVIDTKGTTTEDTSAMENGAKIKKKKKEKKKKEIQNEGDIEKQKDADEIHTDDESIIDGAKDKDNTSLFVIDTKGSTSAIEDGEQIKKNKDEKKKNKKETQIAEVMNTDDEMITDGDSSSLFVIDTKGSKNQATEVQNFDSSTTKVAEVQIDSDNEKKKDVVDVKEKLTKMNEEKEKNTNEPTTVEADGMTVTVYEMIDDFDDTIVSKQGGEEEVNAEDKEESEDEEDEDKVSVDEGKDDGDDDNDDDNNDGKGNEDGDNQNGNDENDKNAKGNDGENNDDKTEEHVTMNKTGSRNEDGAENESEVEVRSIDSMSTAYDGDEDKNDITVVEKTSPTKKVKAVPSLTPNAAKSQKDAISTRQSRRLSQSSQSSPAKLASDPKSQIRNSLRTSTRSSNSVSEVLPQDAGTPKHVTRQRSVSETLDLKKTPSRHMKRSADNLTKGFHSIIEVPDDSSSPSAENSPLKGQTPMKKKKVLEPSPVRLKTPVKSSRKDERNSSEKVEEISLSSPEKSPVPSRKKSPMKAVPEKHMSPRKSSEAEASSPKKNSASPTTDLPSKEGKASTRKSSRKEVLEIIDSQDESSDQNVLKSPRSSQNRKSSAKNVSSDSETKRPIKTPSRATESADSKLKTSRMSLRKKLTTDPDIIVDNTQTDSEAKGSELKSHKKSTNDSTIIVDNISSPPKSSKKSLRKKQASDSETNDQAGHKTSDSEAHKSRMSLRKKQLNADASTVAEDSISNDTEAKKKDVANSQSLIVPDNSSSPETEVFFKDKSTPTSKKVAATEEEVGAMIRTLRRNMATRQRSNSETLDAEKTPSRRTKPEPAKSMTAIKSVKRKSSKSSDVLDSWLRKSNSTDTDSLQDSSSRNSKEATSITSLDDSVLPPKKRKSASDFMNMHDAISDDTSTPSTIQSPGVSSISPMSSQSPENKATNKKYNLRHPDGSEDSVTNENESTKAKSKTKSPLTSPRTRRKKSLRSSKPS